MQRVAVAIEPEQQRLIDASREIAAHVRVAPRRTVRWRRASGLATETAIPASNDGRAHREHGRVVLGKAPLGLE